MKLSHSAITTYLDCQKKYDLCYNKGLKFSNIHTQFGSMAHEVMETHIIPDEMLYPELKDEFGITSWTKYFTDIQNELDLYMRDLGYVQIEKELEIEDDDFIGIIDAVWKKDNQILITDYKFSNGYKGYEELYADEQMYLYAYLYATKNGVNLNDISTGYISIPKRQLDPPRTLKNGGLSKDKAQFTTYQQYYDKICELGLPMEDYQDVLDSLKNKPYLQIVINKLNLGRLQDVLLSIYNVMKDMKKGYYLEKNSYTCTKCDCYEFCKRGKVIP